MKKRWIICLGAGESQVPLIRNAQLLGYKVLAIDRNPKAPGLELADEIMLESTYDAKNIIKKLDSRKWSALIARCTGKALFTAAEIVKKLGLAGVDQSLAQIATSKSALREYSFEHDISMPRGMKISAAGCFNNSLNHGDIVIKPDFTVVGKKSIKKVKGQDIEGIIEAIAAASSYSGNGLVEIEEFIQGYDCTYLVWLENGKSTTLFTWDELVEFDDEGDLYAIGVSTPSVSSIISQDIKVQKVINKVAMEFSYLRTLVAFSFRMDLDGKPWLIELHADLTGDLILDRLAPEATGNDCLLMLTRLLIDGNMARDSKDWGVASIEPTALIYQGPEQIRNDVVILKAQDICNLHESISNYLGGVLLGQYRFLCLST